MPESPEDDQLAEPTEDAVRSPRTHAAPQGQGASRWVAPLALLVALVAVGLAVWSLMGGGSNSSSSAAHGSNPHLPGDAKQRACGAVDTVSKAVTLQTHADLGQDPVAMEAVAANARGALFAGGQYLLNSIDSNTPSNLADAVRDFAYDLQDIGINAFAGEKNSDTDQAARLARGDAARKQIIELCK